MAGFLKGTEVLELLKIKDFELIEHIKNGLTPYDEIGHAIDLHNRCEEAVRACIEFERWRIEEINSTWAEMNDSMRASDSDVKDISVANEEKKRLIEEAQRKIEQMEQYLLSINNGEFNLPHDKSLAEGIMDQFLYCIYKRDAVLDLKSPPAAGQMERAPDNPLNPQQQREYGTLKQEAQKQETILKATAYAMEFCIAKGEKVRKDELFDALRKQFKDKLPESAFEKIRKGIRDQFPGKYIKDGGRPKKN